MMWSEYFDLMLEASAAEITLAVHGKALAARQTLGLEPIPIEKRVDFVWQEARKIYAFNSYKKKLRQA
jgi:hypothetical protein